VPIDHVAALNIPQADAIFFPLVMNDSPGPISMKFEYDGDLTLRAWRIE
jgi:hypothetical protein